MLFSEVLAGLTRWFMYCVHFESGYPGHAAARLLCKRQHARAAQTKSYRENLTVCTILLGEKSTSTMSPRTLSSQSQTQAALKPYTTTLNPKPEPQTPSLNESPTQPAARPECLSRSPFGSSIGPAEERFQRMTQSLAGR